MSDLFAKANYLKGLAEGIKLDKNTDEGKLLAEVISVLGEIAQEVDNVNRTQDSFEIQMAEIEDDIEIIAASVARGMGLEGIGESIELQCSNCGEITTFDIESADDEIICPACGEEIELDFDCGCDCDDCEGCN